MKTQIFDKMKDDLKGHPRSYKTTFMPKTFYSSTFVYGLILMKSCMNANIMKTHLFINVTFMLWRRFVIILL